MTLPESYLKNMEEILSDRYEAFLRSYDEVPVKGLRFNTRKVRPETVRKLVSDWKLEPVPWCREGFYYHDVRPGLSPYHDAGVFYMQEPSAMSVVEMAGLSDNDRVLDLCAAPGGKTTAASEKCSVLLSNEIIPNRARILSSNIERMGISNAVCCSASPEYLAQIFPGYFDAVIADAPCSGEGMFRKDPDTVREWSTENVCFCIERQKMILQNAAAMLRPGGKLVYSTCTFEPGENERQIADFTEKNPSFRILSMERFWPHEKRGEGHFVCVLSYGEPTPSDDRSEESAVKEISLLEKRLSSNGIHILRAGLVKGSSFKDKKNRSVYEPSHAEIMAVCFENVSSGVNLKTEELALSFLSGNVLRLSDTDAEWKGEDGFTGVYFDGYPLGVGKRAGNVVKNHLPKGLRRI